ncbi:MAG: long-chain-fatty-acid--CoA ligase [Pseudonocardiaceae bacterium]|nr:long-chain-fatty-acid--CoA ligase [Pseudonocardiaceae bacterium]
MLLGDVIDYGARQFPDSDALLFEGSTTTYTQLRRRAGRLAAALSTMAGPGDRVAVLAENRPEFVEAYYGVPMAGMALTFINYRLHPEEIAYILVDSGARVLITEPRYLVPMLELRDRLPELATVICTEDGEPVAGDLGYEQALAQAPPDEPPRGSEDDLAWLIYTSGTTGRPKGAMLTHRNLLTSLTSWMIESAPGIGDTCLMPFPLCHVSGYGVLGYALRGSTLVLRRSFDPEDFLACVERHRVSHTPLAPTMLSMVLAHPAADRYDTSSLQVIAYGGSSMPVEILRRGMARFPSARFNQGFGMTELGGNVLFLDGPTHERAAESAPELLGAAGRPMPLAVVRVVDDAMADVAVGEVGEIVVRGDQVTAGYWRNEQATAEVFAGGWFHTGDMGTVDGEGFVSVVDRKKDMIVTGGENVYSREVEEVLYRHPGVAEVAVVGLPDEKWGENVCAVVVAATDAPPLPEELTELCSRHLASYKKPKVYRFIAELPKNASGKILKRQLREAAQPAAAGNRTTPRTVIT